MNLGTDWRGVNQREKRARVWGSWMSLNPKLPVLKAYCFYEKNRERRNKEIGTSFSTLYIGFYYLTYRFNSFFKFIVLF